MRLRRLLPLMLFAALAACGGVPEKPGNGAVAANASQGAAAPGEALRARPEAEQRAIAFKAVFGDTKPGAEKIGGTFSTKADTLIWQGDHAILITVTEGEDACHACSGSLGLYYLVPEDDGFRVTGKFPEAVPGNGFGGAPSEWSVSDKFGPTPVIYSEAGWTGQGYTCTNFRLTELRADKPVEVASVPIYYSDEDSGSPEAKGTLEGKFGPIVPGKSFTLNYAGFKSFSQTWVRKGDKYVLSGADQMETC